MTENESLECSFGYGPIMNTKLKATPIPIHNVGKAIGNGHYRAQVEAIRAENDEKKKKELKAQLDYILPAGVFTKRKADAIVKYSGMVCMDVDGKDNPTRKVQEMRLECLNDPLMHAILLFYSPTYTGIKVFLRYDKDTYSYLESFNAYWMYFKEKLHINVDYCADVPRACFMSYDPNVMYNEREPISLIPVDVWSKRFEEVKSKKETQQKPSTVPKQTGSDTLDHVMAVLKRICEKKADIAPTYDDYYHLGLSLANLGDAGLPVFLKCCSFNTNPKRTDPANDFRVYLKDTRRDVSLATYFNLSKNAGIDISRPINTEPSVNDRIIEIEDPMRLPLFSNLIFDNLPPLLRSITDHYELIPQKCMMLLASVGTISSVLPGLHINYDGTLLEPNMFIFIIGPSGSGKGKVQNCLRLIQPIHDVMMEKSKKEYLEYMVKLNKLRNSKSNAEETERSEAEPVPPIKLFHLPGNITAAYIVRMLAVNGGRGLILETESDTLANMLSKDYGDFSDLLRKIPHHEEYTMARQGEEKNENYTIKHPCVSVVLTGTPNQLPNLIHNTEDGLFGRFCYWYVAQAPMWRNPYAHQDEAPDSELFDELAKDIYVIHTKLECLGEKGVRFKFTDEQIGKLNDVFLDLYIKNYKLYEGEFDGVMFRLGISHARLAMTLTALRQPGIDSFNNDLICSDTDFNIATEMIKTMESHSTYSFRRLNGIGTKRPNITDERQPKFIFHELLPDVFTKKDAIDLCRKLRISHASAYRYLADFEKDKNGRGKFIEKIGDDKYRKIKKKP